MILKNNYNFDESNIITLYNPEKNDVKRQLLELTNIIKPEDNLVIFYAGHGLWVEKDKKGYWMLIDSKLDDANTWLPNKDVLDLIAKLPSRHTLLITDACFSGSVFKTCLLYTSPSPRDRTRYRMPSSAWKKNKKLKKTEKKKKQTHEFVAMHLYSRLRSYTISSMILSSSHTSLHDSHRLV